jgi:hypothetical protein
VLGFLDLPLLAGTDLGSRIHTLFLPQTSGAGGRADDDDDDDGAGDAATVAAFITALHKLAHAEPAMQADVLMMLFDGDKDGRLTPADCHALLKGFAEAMYGLAGAGGGGGGSTAARAGGAPGDDAAAAAAAVSADHSLEELEAAVASMLDDMLVHADRAAPAPAADSAAGADQPEGAAGAVGETDARTLSKAGLMAWLGSIAGGGGGGSTAPADPAVVE